MHGTLRRALYTRIGAALVFHGVLVGLTFEACSASLASLSSLLPHVWLRRLHHTLAVVVVHSVPLLGRVVFGQAGGRHWSLLRVDTAPREATTPQAFVIQVAMSSAAAVTMLWELVRVVDDKAPPGSPLTTMAEALLLLGCGVAAAVADAVRGLRRAEGDLTFPALSANNLWRPLLDHFAVLLVETLRSTAQFLVVLLVLHFGLSFWSFLGPSPAGDGAGMELQPLFTLGLLWRALVSYATTYMLLGQGAFTLKHLLTMPIDFRRLASAYPSQPLPFLLLETMSLGWERYIYEDGLESSDGLFPADVNGVEPRVWKVLLAKQQARLARMTEDLKKRETARVSRAQPFLALAAVTPTLSYNQHDHNLTFLELIARALAFQHASQMAAFGGPLRREVVLDHWSVVLGVCCLVVDTSTLQFQIFLADRKRGEASLFPEAQATQDGLEWMATTTISALSTLSIATQSRMDQIWEQVHDHIWQRTPQVLKDLKLLDSPFPQRHPAAHTQVLLWAVEALTHTLVAASREDRSANSRAAVPVALTSLIACQLALESLMLACPLNAVTGSGGHQQLLPEHEAISVGLELGITLLVRTYRDALPSFTFPPIYAARLQRYVANAE